MCHNAIGIAISLTLVIASRDIYRGLQRTVRYGLRCTQWIAHARRPPHATAERGDRCRLSTPGARGRAARAGRRGRGRGVRAVWLSGKVRVRISLSVSLSLMNTIIYYVDCGCVWRLVTAGRGAGTEKRVLREAVYFTTVQCGIFTGIGPKAESNHVTLRIKYGKIPKKTGISPDPAAESKVGYIPPFWHATVARPCVFVRAESMPKAAKPGLGKSHDGDLVQRTLDASAQRPSPGAHRAARPAATVPAQANWRKKRKATATTQ